MRPATLDLNLMARSASVGRPRTNLRWLQAAEATELGVVIDFPDDCATMQAARVAVSQRNAETRAQGLSYHLATRRVPGAPDRLWVGTADALAKHNAARGVGPAGSFWHGNPAAT